MFNNEKSNWSGKIIFTLLTLYGCNIFSQWQPDVRLTNDPAPSTTSYNNAWCIASNGNTLHVVWQDYRDGNLEIYYKRSTDGGVNWGTDVRLTNDGAFSENPTIAVSGQTVHIAWQDNRPGAGNNEIYYKRSTDNGSTWSTDIRLTNNAAFSMYPSMAVTGQDVHIVWDDTRDADYEIYYKHSTDGGVSWGADTRLTNSTGISVNPCIAINGAVIHVVWYDQRDGNNYHIYYKRSTDNGASWGTDTRLSDINSNSADPCISLAGSLINVGWEDNRDGNIEIYNKRSTDGGTTWSADSRLTNNSADSRHPSIASSGSAVHVVWDDNRDGFQQLYYKRSTDGGVSFSADLRITNAPPFSAYPSVSLSGTSVHVVWQDQRDGNVEIYYKKDPTGNPAGIVNISSGIPERYSLSQNYPNPFNPSTMIKFSILKIGFVKLTVYDIVGREVEILIAEELNAGVYRADFDASRYSSGIYLYKLEANDYVQTKKMMLIK